jgi:hypothetical protein
VCAAACRCAVCGSCTCWVLERLGPRVTCGPRSRLPGEIFAAPRSWVEQGYPTLTYFHEAGRGGHFAAWEEPGLFSEEIRAAFRLLR